MSARENVVHVSEIIENLQRFAENTLYPFEAKRALAEMDMWEEYLRELTRRPASGTLTRDF